jgi:hypothetical protein
LIKVGDNGPLSATAKVLSDGLGNDSPLSMSTSNVGIGISSPVYKLQINASGGNAISLIGDVNNEASILFGDSGSAVIGRLTYDNATDSMRIFTNGTEQMRITSAGNVGIGTSTPLAILQTTTAGTAANEVGLRLNNPNGNVAPTGVDIIFQSGYTTGIDGAAVIRGGRNSAATDSYISFQTNSGSGLAEVGRWLPTGGLTFNGDTAAANALDDYEEGTWTPNFTLNSGSVSAYTSSGSYTKIGKVVNLTMRITFTTTLLAEIDEITGYPFTSQTSSPLALGAVREATNSGKMWQWLAFSNSTQGILRRYDNDKVLTNGDSFVGTLTYFV